MKHCLIQGRRKPSSGAVGVKPRAQSEVLGALDLLSLTSLPDPGAGNPPKHDGAANMLHPPGGFGGRFLYF